ncbi:Kazal-type serine protease inhibitor [Bradyrhizobium sp. CCGB20]|uniref:Kazal-type serine protease inhibitor n=1 Tax=Bradyrhizobium sp. CCGB20 TaxID=2949633 RepID=UPI0035C6DF80
MRAISTATSFIFLGISNALAVELPIEGKTVDVPVCGGFANIPCKANEWCNFPSSNRCGIGDQFGVCRTRPQLCPQYVMPVCGCDGKSYNNACEAARAGTDTAHAGRCGAGG